MPKVSVIMPVYNGQAYIEQAIDSLLAQSFQDWELVVVDDGSSDSTPQILKKFTDERIRTIRQENAGEATARNVGLENAKGEYVAFLDADDYYFSNALDDLSSFLDQNLEFGVVYSNGQIFDGENRSIMTLSEIRPGFYTGNILEQLVISSNLVTVPVCTMTRRREICDHSVQFDPHLVIGPDWDFWIQLAVHTGFGYLDSLTCKYRVHNLNITRTVDAKKRRNDQAFGRLKVMNSSWFDGLSLSTKQSFFYDLMLNIASGNPDLQTKILKSSQFEKLPDYSKAYLWRMVGIDALQNDQDANRAKICLRESLKIEPSNMKTQLVLLVLQPGRFLALSMIGAWRFALHMVKIFTSPNYVRLIRLRRMFGLR
jgi:glycosyltransferase involved in cell wall biosynthesis